MTDTSLERDATAGATSPDSSTGRAGRIRVGVIGATGYVGGELIRILARHPGVELVAATGRDRRGDPIDGVHPHLAASGVALDAEIGDDVEAVFLALPHGIAASLVPSLLERGVSVIDQGADFRLRDASDYPTWYGFEHPAPELLGRAVYGLPELHRDELRAAGVARTEGVPALVASPGCYPTATLLALAPLARAGLIADLVVDAKSGVSGAGRDLKAEMLFSEVNESVRAYGVDGHRHVAEMEQELSDLAHGRVAGRDMGIAVHRQRVDFLPHLIPMTRGILAACHVRTVGDVDQDQLDALYRDAYADEPFVSVVAAPPATKHVYASNDARVFVRHDPRTGRVLAIAVVDNLVKGAAGQGVQAFNIVHGLPETAGLEQLPLAP